MKSDYQIQEDVMEELKWEPFLKASEIGVAVKNGVVTLSGQVDSYSKKVAAENAAKKVAGVKAVAEDIQVGVSPSYRKTDAEIAQAVLDALKWQKSQNTTYYTFTYFLLHLPEYLPVKYCSSIII